MTRIEQKINDAKMVDLAGIYKTCRNKKGNYTWIGDKKTQFYINKNHQSRANDFRGNHKSNIDFVMEVEKLSFIEAMDFLLKKAGINPSKYYDKKEYIRSKEAEVKTRNKNIDKKENSSNLIEFKSFDEIFDYFENEKNQMKKEETNMKNIDKSSRNLKNESAEKKLDDFRKLQLKEKKEKENYEKILRENRISNNSGTYFYLVAIRGIDEEIFKFFYKNGYLMRGTIDANGRKKYKKEWDGNIKEDKSVTYFVYKNPLTNKITGMVARSNNDMNRFQRNFRECEWGFGIAKGEIKKVTIFEAPIDLLSYLSLFKNSQKLNNNYLFATCGMNKKMIKNNLKKLDNVSEIIVATDNDKGGEKYFNMIKNEFKDKYHISREKSNSKDWNDDLLAVKKKLVS